MSTMDLKQRYSAYEKTIENMRQFLTMTLPWASDEIEQCITDMYELLTNVQKYEQFVYDQDLQIKHLQHKNNEYKLINTERLQIYDELEKQIYHLERTNQNYKDEQILSEQCIKQLHEIVENLEQKCLNLQMELNNKNLELQSLKNPEPSSINQNIENLEQFENLQKTLNDLNVELTQKIEENQNLKSNMDAIYQDFQILNEKYTKLCEELNESRCICSNFSEIHEEVIANNMTSLKDELLDVIEFIDSGNEDDLPSTSSPTSFPPATQTIEVQTDVKFGPTTQSIEIQTDAKFVCYIAENNTNLSVFETTDSLMKIPRTQRVYEIFNLLRRKFSNKQRKSIGINTDVASNMFSMELGNITVECDNASKNRVAKCLNQAKFVKKIENDGNIATVSAPNSPRRIWKKLSLHKTTEEVKPMIPTTSNVKETINKLKKLELSYAQIVKKSF